MTICEVLERQHREVDALFKQIEDAYAANKLRLAHAAFRVVSTKLIACMQAEHSVVYPRLSQVVGLHDEVCAALREHDEIERTINHIRLAPLTTEAWMEAVRWLASQVSNHAASEEWILFPVACLAFSRQQLVDLGDDFLRFEPVVAAVAGASITYDPVMPAA
ncbi:MAG TPA: hemerythrin domain-containing protein [Kofleriaceae bacterium]